MRVLRVKLNSTGEHVKFESEDTKFNFGGITQVLEFSDIIIVDCTVNFKVFMNSKTSSSGAMIAWGRELSNINVTNCDVNYTILFKDKGYA